MRFSALFMAGFLLFPVQGFAQTAALRSVTVIGEAKLRVAPDIADFSSQLQELAPTQAEAKQKLDNKVRVWLTVANNFGIAQEDRSTGYASISRQYEWVDSKQRFTGYMAQSNLSLKLRDLGKLATLQDTLAKSGFESVQGPVFSLGESARIRDAALKTAVENARRKAETMVESVGESIGRPLTIIEGGAEGVAPPPMPMMRAMAMDKAESAPPPDMPAGVMEMTAQVTATFELIER